MTNLFAQPKRKTFTDIMKAKGFTDQTIEAMMSTSLGEAAADEFLSGVTLEEYAKKMEEYWRKHGRYEPQGPAITNSSAAAQIAEHRNKIERATR